MVILQGEIYWLDLGSPLGSSPGYRHPHVIVQNNVFNQSLIATTVVCAITSNLKRAASPGNVRLQKGEASLPKDCVVNISQMVTVDKSELKERIGILSASRIRQIVDGILLLMEPREI